MRYGRIGRMKWKGSGRQWSWSVLMFYTGFHLEIEEIHNKSVRIATLPS